MAKYKVGDTLVHNITQCVGYEVKVTLVDAFHYALEVIAPGKTGTLPGYKYVESIASVDFSYSLKAPAKKFNTYIKGDELEMRSIRGFIIEILDTKNGLYEYKVIKTQPNCTPVGAIMSDTYDIIEQNYYLHNFATPTAGHVQGISLTSIRRFSDNTEITKAILTKQCTCDSRALFLKGCRCGAVQPYKLKMR